MAMSRTIATLLVHAALLAAPAVAAAQQPAATSPVPSAGALPVVEVHRNASCGCCLKWVEHLREAGFQVNVHVSDDMQALKRRLGVPDAQRSCHTAQVGGYFVEGHVPAADVRRLLAERPAARGLAVPGMPLGSPGMETPDGTRQPYTVELVAADGTARTYAEHGR